jgi:hypothetical protein
MNLQRIVNNETKKKDSIKKFLDADSQKIILFGGSNDGETALEDIPQEFKEFFNSETAGAFGLGCKFWQSSGRNFGSVPDSGFFGQECSD